MQAHIVTAAAAAALGAALVAAPALAQSQAPPEQAAQTAWLSLSDIDQRLAARGYRTFEIERDDGLYEVKALDSEGRCRELHINPHSGETVREEADDDCGRARR